MADEINPSRKGLRYCSLCRNHNKFELKRNHACPYAQCDCMLCSLSQKVQVAMRHQQRFWRHQKEKLKQQEIIDGIRVKPPLCDQCRNHSILIAKKDHICPNANCNCVFCTLSFKRREVMKMQQRVRRSHLMTVDNNEKEHSRDTGCDNAINFVDRTSSFSRSNEIDNFDGNTNETRFNRNTLGNGLSLKTPNFHDFNMNVELHERINKVRQGFTNFFDQNEASTSTSSSNSPTFEDDMPLNLNLKFQTNFFHR